MLYIVVSVLTVMIMGTVNVLFKNSTIAVSVLIITYTVIVLCIVNYDTVTSKHRSYLSFGLLLRVFLLYFDRYGKWIYHLPNSGADSEMFYQQSVMLATKGIATRKDGFIVLMGHVMKLVGTSRLLNQFIVVIFSFLSLVFIGLALEEISLKPMIKSRIMMVVCLLPNYAILGSIFLRESIVAMFVAISCYFFVVWFNQKLEIYYLLAIICSFAGAYFHTGAIGLAFGYIAIRFLYDNATNKIHITSVNVLITILLVLSLSFIFNNYGQTFLSKMAGVENIEDIANTLELGGSSYARYVGNSNSIGNMIIYTPLRIVYFLFSPFPWQWRGIADIIAFFFSSLYFLYILAHSISYLINTTNNEQKNKQILIMILTMAVVFVYSWGVSNTGTAARHRDKLVPIFAVLWAYSSGSFNYYRGVDKLIKTESSNRYRYIR